MLILAATPIGNLEDASPRLVAALGSADVVAAEDTRRIRRLAADLDVQISGQILSYFEGNEERRTADLLDHLRAGQSVLIVTDAGMPSVSDPGYRIVAAAIENDLEVTAIPGPSAVLTALALSGLPVDRFSFEGFCPRKAGERARLFGELAEDARTMVFFESPHRTQATLESMAEAFGPERKAAVCRELTKTYEEVVRGTVAELASWASEQVRGEVTIVVAGAQPRQVSFDPDTLARLVDDAQEAGMSRKDAIAEVSSSTGVRKSEVYAAAHRG